MLYLQQLTNGSIDLSGLLLAGVIFGGLGVLNDVAISQAATVEELHSANPSLARWHLFTRTMNVGIAHLAATINTLVFAYLGTALPLVVLLVLGSSSLGVSVSGEGVSVEIMRTVVGALGILAAVPITTAIAVRWVVLPGNAGEPPTTVSPARERRVAVGSRQPGTTVHHRPSPVDGPATPPGGIQPVGSVPEQANRSSQSTWATSE